ncbi:hypothetical protein HY639_01295 [Candidatus Woesearchaeota archaeon]|nr:hypothetical protein [Candidatus Woesearchaeota archaeon]
MVKQFLKRLQDKKKIVFTAVSAKNSYRSMQICKYVLNAGSIPINSFNLFGYFLYGMVDKDLIIDANNYLIQRADELWVFGDQSSGVKIEIRIARELGKPIRYFTLDETIHERQAVR